MSDKISISLDEVNSPEVDAKIRIDLAMLRTAEHQKEILRDYKPVPTTNGNIFYKTVVYLALFGLGFGFVGWCASEIFMQVSEQAEKDAIEKARPEVERIIKENAQEIKTKIDSGEITVEKHYYNIIMEIVSKDEEYQIIALACTIFWYILICGIIGFGLSSAERFMEGNYSRAIICGLIAIGIGIPVGIIGLFVAGFFYNTLGGGQLETNFAVQMFARALAWLFIGCFVGIAPGMVMRNWKKFGLGVAGGAVGGLLGGLFFDPISIVTQTAVLSRLVGIVGFGVLAGIAIGLMEEAAKQGWLKVVAGVIAGKQFIIYKNPTVIGSSPKCEIYLFKDTDVMPQHAAIRQQGNSYIIEQLDQRRPLFISGQPVQRHTLRNGDQIGIGKSLFVFGTKEIQNH
ncbi:MAG: FHA domain-containing protein [Planctomycetaceae bacterium]|jgi:hypothetical protein|nr:FHA domain-containing protein [Planctomycetaceae bacterium]